MLLLCTLASVAIGYLLGSIPVGFLAARALRGIDVTKVGSGRIGGSNVLRAAGWVPAILTVLGDTLKGYGPVLLARVIAPDVPVAPILAGLGSVAGHNWSIFLRFTGGVGTATSVGAGLALLPLPTAVSMAVGVTAVAIWKHTSLGSITFALMLILTSIVSGVTGATAMVTVLFTVGTAVMALRRLRPNIERLRRGTERKLGEFIPAGKKDVQHDRS